MPGKKEKASKRRSSFRTFGVFLTSHMMRKFTRKNNKKQAVDNAALEAGFIDKDGSPKLNSHKDTDGATNGTSSETTSLNGKVVHSANLSDAFTPPGVCGLANHGATCYMNAVLQCLSNTDLLAEYFVMGQYKTDLRNARKERSKKYGTNGELAEQVALIMKSLWMDQYDVSMTKCLKEIMCKYSSQYKGNEQHDCQEYLLWLFDKVHEDLNIQRLPKRSLLSKASFRRKKKVPITENGGGRIMPESRDIQMQLDIVPTSFIQKVFQAHFRSTLTCPNCQKQSHTMDPSLCVSLPITQRSTRPVYVNVAYLPSKRRGDRKKPTQKIEQIGCVVPLDGVVLHLRQHVAAESRTHSRLLVFVEYDDRGFGASYGDDTPIDKLPQVSPAMSKLYAFEMPAPMKMTAGTLPRNFASRHKKRPSLGDGESIMKDALGSPDDTGGAVPKNIVVILATKKNDGKISKVFGQPLIFHVPKDILNSDFRALVAAKMSDKIKKSADSEKLMSSFSLEVVDGLLNKCSISEESHPLLTSTVEMALRNCPAGGPLHVKLVAEWKLEDWEVLFEEVKSIAVEELDSVRLQRLLHQQPLTCTLQECFDLLTKPEELGQEDSWMCPHCHKQRQGTVKKLSLYTLPDVLVVHLKRFQVVKDKRTKLNTRVDFPIMGLDLAPYLVENLSHKSTQNGGHRFMNGMRIYDTGSKREDCLYDLYAVCNHFGNLNSGHYTASCLNPLDGQWYLFDDKKTELISDENLSQQSVYILFYQRRSLNPSSPCAGGSVSSLAMSDHWAVNLQQPSRQKASSQSRLNEYAVNLPPSIVIATDRVAQKAKPSTNGISVHNKSNNSNQALKLPTIKHVPEPGEQDTDQLSVVKRPSSEKPKTALKNSPIAPPNGRRYSGSYDLYRKERELYRGSRRGENGQSSMKNREYCNPQMHYYQSSAGAQQIVPAEWGRGTHYSNGVQQHQPQVCDYPLLDSYEAVVAHPFVRGVSRQQSVPRSVSKVERAPVNTRRLSERYHHRQRPSSHYDPCLDMYKRTTYF